jgi:hypothetical protein
MFPAIGIEMPNSAAMLGSSPAMTNSVVPIPNAAIASAQSAAGMALPVEGPVAAWRSA